MLARKNKSDTILRKFLDEATEVSENRKLKMVYFSNENNL
jgi:hypothetical protein